jgi:hypothetical protein
VGGVGGVNAAIIMSILRCLPLAPGRVLSLAIVGRRAARMPARRPAASALRLAVTKAPGSG